MITGLIQPKKWKKFFAVGLAAVVAVVGTTCVVLRTAPHLSDELDATARVAAGFILPDGAAQTLLQTEEQPDTAMEQSEESAAAEPSSASSAPESSLESSVSKAEKTNKTWSGKPYPIEELVLQNGGVQYGSIFVKNENDYTAIDIEEELSKTPDLSIQKDGTPQVLLYHTHTMEAYLEEESDTFYSDMETRTRDESKSVVAVGDAIAKRLEAAGIGVIHDKTIHDEQYNGSYNRSAETIEENLEKYPTIQVTIDVHRDAMTAQNGTRYKPTVTINGKKAAQIMIISGCDDDGTLGFPDWEYNLRLALRLQQAGTEIDPHFVRPLLFGPHIYNENSTHNSLLVEFGTEVNTVEEAVYSGELFGDALVSVLDQFTA
ncbi:MAG: stage II sporulation protein P [Oscillospiraceae bacterium]|nr:stage II sporulation protein P [Oscillospiraceae bacterium]